MNNHLTKILFVDHTPFAGGAQLVLADHIRELNRQHFDPYIVCSDIVPELVDKYTAAGALVKIAEFPRLRGFKFGAAWQFLRVVSDVRKIILENNIDLVVSNTTRASYIVTLATLGTRVPVIWWVRDFLYPKMLFSLLQPFVAKTLYVSKAIQLTYVDADNAKAEVVYVANTIYKQLPGITASNIKAEKKRWGIKDNDIVVGYMGRLVADKGVEDVLEAANLLRDTHPNLKFLIVGTGKNQMNDVEKDLHQFIKENNLEESVILTGFQSNEPLYYSLFDIFVLPTRDGEPFATSVVQAMMAGKAVIGTRAGGTPELVVNNVTGLLFTPRQVQELSEAINKLVSDKQLRDKIASEGKKRVLQYHREEVVTDQIESIYNKVVKSGGN